MVIALRQINVNVKIRTVERVVKFILALENKPLIQTMFDLETESVLRLINVLAMLDIMVPNVKILAALVWGLQIQAFAQKMEFVKRLTIVPVSQGFSENNVSIRSTPNTLKSQKSRWGMILHCFWVKFFSLSPEKRELIN